MRLIPDVGDYLPLLAVAFVAAAVLALVLTPARPAGRDPARHTSTSPNHRRVNKAAGPARRRRRGRGLRSCVVALGWTCVNNRPAWSRCRARSTRGSCRRLLLGGAVATVLGVLDDTFQLRARWQLLGQVLLALLAVRRGHHGQLDQQPVRARATSASTGRSRPGSRSLWIVGMINSINFIDGLDGLSSGIALIAAATLGLIIAHVRRRAAVRRRCCASRSPGALLGFLRWNFHPASIFIGTSGVMFVGYTLAVLSILGTAKVAVALLVLGVPIIDTFWIIVRRLATGRSPFTPDRGHIHHRLLDLGLSHSQTVLVIYGLCIVLAVLSFVLSGTGQLYAFLGLGVVFGLVLFLLTRTETADALEADTYDEPPPRD